MKIQWFGGLQRCLLGVALLLAQASGGQTCPENDCTPYERPFYQWDGGDGRILMAVPVSFLVSSEDVPVEVASDPKFADIRRAFDASILRAQQRKRLLGCAPYGAGGLMASVGRPADTRPRTALDMVEAKSLALLGRVEHVTAYWGDFGVMSVAYLRIEEVIKDEEDAFAVSELANILLSWGTFKTSGMTFCIAPPPGLDAGLNENFQGDRVLLAGNYDRWNTSFVEVLPERIFRVVDNQALHPKGKIHYTTGSTSLATIRSALDIE